MHMRDVNREPRKHHHVHLRNHWRQARRFHLAGVRAWVHPDRKNGDRNDRSKLYEKQYHKNQRVAAVKPIDEDEGVAVEYDDNSTTDDVMLAWGRGASGVSLSSGSSI